MIVPIKKADKIINGFLVGYVKEKTEDGQIDIQAIFPDISEFEFEKISDSDISQYFIVFNDLIKAEKFINESKINNPSYEIGYCNIDIEEGTMYYEIPENGYLIVPLNIKTDE